MTSVQRRAWLKGGAALALGPGLVGCGGASENPPPRVWQTQGDAGASNALLLNDDPALSLRHSGAAAYQVTSFRSLAGLAPGSYTLRARCVTSGLQPSCFAFARSTGLSLARTSLPISAGAQTVVIPGISVSDGQMVLGLHSQAEAGQWAELSDIALTREAVPRPFLAGGDISVLSWLEVAGAQYFDRAGHPRDALQILRDNGHSIVRIRLYDTPGPGHGDGAFYWPQGSMNLPDVLSLARRAVALGLQIQLTLHYSDFWTNSASQRPPLAWQKELSALPDEASRMARLVELVSERTREVMAAMLAQGTPPQFVSLGNEIEDGLLYPYGRSTTGNWPRLGALLRAGYEAVKTIHPASRVILHIDDGGNVEKYRWWFDSARAVGVQWDLIGCSYYPFWTKRTVAEMARFCQIITAHYNSDLFVMEAGFNWNPTLPSGYPGQLTNNGPYPASMSSPQGQRQFMDELFQALKQTERVMGLLYWDPIMIAAPGVGWALHEGNGRAGENTVSNTTLFDFGGRALPVLDLWRDHAAAMPPLPPKA